MKSIVARGSILFPVGGFMESLYTVIYNNNNNAFNALQKGDGVLVIKLRKIVDKTNHYNTLKFNIGTYTYNKLRTSH